MYFVRIYFYFDIFNSNSSSKNWRINFTLRDKCLINIINKYKSCDNKKKISDFIFVLFYRSRARPRTSISIKIFRSEKNIERNWMIIVSTLKRVLRGKRPETNRVTMTTGRYQREKVCKEYRHKKIEKNSRFFLFARNGDALKDALWSLQWLKRMNR